MRITCPEYHENTTKKKENQHEITNQTNSVLEQNCAVSRVQLFIDILNTIL